MGTAFPLHCTGIGKVLLSRLDSDEARSILSGKLKARTPNTITDKRQLHDELSEIRRRGYAIDNEEITRGMICIAAPVFGPDDSVAGALSCTFPTWIRDERGIDHEIESVLQAAAASP